jgi:fructose-1,6-bisphosphatase/inositol monophosphatase family enzyme
VTLSPEFLDNSEEAINTVMAAYRPTLLELSGSISHELKDDKTPVTQLDLEIESKLREALAGVDGTVGFEGEEHGIEGSRETFWLIDPIDGTEQFIRGIPAYRAMATLINDGEPQYAYVYDIAKDERYTARKGQGTLCNGQPARLSERPLERAFIELTANLNLEDTYKIIHAIRQHTRGVRMTADFTHTLQGRFEGHLYYKASGSFWDWSPWALLIKEAGGKVANFGSDNYDYKNPSFLAATPTVFDQLKPILDEVLKESL